MRIVAMPDKVLLRKAEAKKMTEGGLHLPDNVKQREKTVLAEVVSIGTAACSCGADRTGPSAEAHTKDCPAEDHLKYGISVGSKVIVAQYCGHEVDYGGEKLVAVNPREILALIVE